LPKSSRLQSQSEWLACYSVHKQNDRRASDVKEGTMKRGKRLALMLETLSGVLAASLAIVTLFWRHWIEATFAIDPDQNSGVLEWLIVAGLIGAAAACGLAARAELRRIRAVTGSLGFISLILRGDITDGSGNPQNGRPGCRHGG
jgi:hypothetical protein